MRKPTTSVSFAFPALVMSARPQEQSENFAEFAMGLDDAAPVAKSLTKQLNESKPFEVVAKNDSIKVVVLIPSMPRMGGGLIFAKSADDLANNLRGSIAQDIVE